MSSPDLSKTRGRVWVQRAAGAWTECVCVPYLEDNADCASLHSGPPLPSSNSGPSSSVSVRAARYRRLLGGALHTSAEQGWVALTPAGDPVGSASERHTTTVACSGAFWVPSDGVSAGPLPATGSDTS